MRQITSIIKLASLLIVMTIISGALSPSPSAKALSGSDFQAGRIIDDGVFFDSQGMSVGQIQQFLNAKVPSCDTNGTQPYGNTTTGDYGRSVGYGPPYYCLRDFHLDTPSRDAEAGLCRGYTGTNGQSSSEIIYNVSQSCNINPKVLLVLLQKEQGLVTDTWPFSLQYRTATGYGCPDTAACDSQYYGFFNQVYNAARQFRKYAKDPGNFNYVAGRNNFILYNPNSSCGGSDVYIQNQATANLYNYTPYQPNAGSLASLTENNSGGTTNCGAYGNRNFWWYFNNWFGSTTVFNATVLLDSSLNVSRQNPTYENDSVTASYTVKNTASYGVDVGGLGICARLNGINFDFGFQNSVSINPNSTITISYTRKIDRSGILNVFLCSYSDRAGGWADNHYPYAITDLARQATFEIRRNPLITTGLSISPSNPTLGEPTTATFTITNNSSSALTIPYVGVAARDESGANVGFASDGNVTIAPGDTYTYSKTRTFSGAAGIYRFFITSLINNAWNDNYPLNADGVARDISAKVYPNPVITTSLSISPSTPTLNEPVTATFTVKNNGPSAITIPYIGVAVRDGKGENVGLPSDGNVTIAAGGTYTYNKTRTFTANPGMYRFFITSFVNNNWNDGYPVNLDGLNRSASLVVYDNPIVSTGLSLSPSAPMLNQPVTATFTVKNNSPSTVTIPYVGVAVRDAKGGNVGFASDANVTIAAGGTYAYSKTRTFTANPGMYRFFITSFVNNNWNDEYPIAPIGIPRTLSVNVQ